MSMYNMMNGFNPACVFIMPMLGRKQHEWPRFRDCWVTEENNIAIYTRVGGGNRNCGFGEEELYEELPLRAPRLQQPADRADRPRDGKDHDQPRRSRAGPLFQEAICCPGKNGNPGRHVAI